MNVEAQSPCVTKCVVSDERKKFDDDDDGAFKGELSFSLTALKFFSPAETLNFVADVAAEGKGTNFRKRSWPRPVYGSEIVRPFVFETIFNIIAPFLFLGTYISLCHRVTPELL